MMLEKVVYIIGLIGCEPGLERLLSTLVLSVCIRKLIFILFEHDLSHLDQ
jgi:hypothetical protein